MPTSDQKRDMEKKDTHHAAPTTDNEMDNPIPRLDHIYGEVSVRNLYIKEYLKILRALPVTVYEITVLTKEEKEES